MGSLAGYYERSEGEVPLGRGRGGVIAEPELRAAEGALDLPGVLGVAAFLGLRRVVEQVVGEAVRALRAAGLRERGDEKGAHRGRHIYEDAGCRRQVRSNAVPLRKLCG